MKQLTPGKSKKSKPGRNVLLPQNGQQNTGQQCQKNKAPVAERNMDILDKLFDESSAEEILKSGSTDELLGMTPLAVVASMGHQEGTQKFIDAGAVIDEKCSGDGNTPLMLAIQRKLPKVVEMLLEKGADVSLRNKEGNNALMVAVKTGDARIFNAVWAARGDIDINQSNKLLCTALHLAVEKKWDSCIHFLLANGAWVDAPNHAGVTPLMTAVDKNDIKNVLHCVGQGSEITKEDFHGITAVCRAIEGEREEIVKYFLNKMTEQEKETYVKSRVERIRSPLVKNSDLEDFYADTLFPVFEEISKDVTFRELLYRHKVIPNVIGAVQKHMRDAELVSEACHVCCMMIYHYATFVEERFVVQFIQARGPEILVKALKLYTEHLKVVDHECMAVCFLPILSLCEVDLGKQWLQKNCLNVTPYTEMFKMHLENISFPDEGSRLKAKIMWCRFLDFYEGIRKKQQEETIVELLEDEEREKARKEKKREKKRLKRQKHQQEKQEKLLQSMPMADCEDEMMDPYEPNEAGAMTDLQKTPIVVCPLSLEREDQGSRNTEASKVSDYLIDRKTDIQNSKSKAKKGRKEETDADKSDNKTLLEVTDNMSLKPPNPEKTPTSEVTMDTSHLLFMSNIGDTGDWTTVVPKRNVNSTQNQSIAKQKHFESLALSNDNCHGSLCISAMKANFAAATERRYVNMTQIVKQTHSPVPILAPAKLKAPETSKVTHSNFSKKISEGNTHSVAIQNLAGNHELPDFIKPIDLNCKDTFKTINQIVKDYDEEFPSLGGTSATNQGSSRRTTVKEPATFQDGATAASDSSMNLLSLMVADSTNSSDGIWATDSAKSGEPEEAERTNMEETLVQKMDDFLKSDADLSEQSGTFSSSSRSSLAVASSPAFNAQTESLISLYPYRWQTEREIDCKNQDTFSSERSIWMMEDNNSAMWENVEPEVNVITENTNANEANAEVEPHFPTQVDMQAPYSSRDDIVTEPSVHDNSQDTSNALPLPVPIFNDLEAEDPCVLAYCKASPMKTNMPPLIPVFGVDMFQMKTTTSAENNDIQSVTPSSVFGHTLLPLCDVSSVTNCSFSEKSELLNDEHNNHAVESSHSPRAEETRQSSPKRDKWWPHMTSTNNAYNLDLKWNNSLTEADYNNIDNCLNVPNMFIDNADDEFQPLFPSDLADNSTPFDHSDALSNPETPKPDDNIFPGFHTEFTAQSLIDPSLRNTLPIFDHLRNSHIVTENDEPMKTSAGLDTNVHEEGCSVVDTDDWSPTSRRWFKRLRSQQDLPVSKTRKASYGTPVSAATSNKADQTTLPGALRDISNQFRVECVPDSMATAPMPELLHLIDQVPQLCGNHNLETKDTYPACDDCPEDVTNVNWQPTSRRWKDKLKALHDLPSEERRQLGKIILPIDGVPFSITSGSKPVSLGFLTDGSEVAVKALLKQDVQLSLSEMDKLISSDTQHYFLSKYKAFEMSGDHFYLAMELCEYTLEEYINIVHIDHRLDPLSSNRMVWQLLKGLKYIHDNCHMAHRNLKPRNILVDLKGRIRLSDYGFCDSTIDPGFHNDDRSWQPTELLLGNSRCDYTIKSDIQVAGMLMYYILTGGHHPFGKNQYEIEVNQCRNWTQMMFISEEANDLIMSMLSYSPANRPAVNDTLRHPYFWSDEKRFRFILISGSDVLKDMKTGAPESTTTITMIEYLNNMQYQGILSEWMTEIDPIVMKEMRPFRQYKSTVAELVLFIYNCCYHFEKISPETREFLDDPCKYFLTKFPTLFLGVYRAIQVSDRSSKPCYKPFF